MRKCYIAGPMRGIPKYNYPAFMEAADLLLEAGWTVFNPAAMDIEHDQVDYTEFSLEDQQLHDNAMNARRFARRDVRIIIDKMHAEAGDAVVVLPGWKNSTGAKAEVAVARWVFLPILTLPEALALTAVPCYVEA